MQQNELTDNKRYFNYFRLQLEKFESIQDDLHQRILIITMLSALAVGRYPKEKESGRQFMKFIEEHSPWRYWTSISVAMLSISESAAPRLNSQIYEGIIHNHDRWRTRTGSEELDPHPEDIIPKGIREEDRKRVLKFKHSALFWSYRNRLVHEFRKPGYGIDDPSNRSPFYHPMTDLNTGHRTVELTYPLAWLKEIAHTAIITLEKYYSESARDAYSSHSFGSHWE